MSWKIQPLAPTDAQEALELLKMLSDNGEVLYKPLEKEDFLNRFFGDKRWGFVARNESGKLGGWIHAAAKTTFLPGETEENTPLYLTMLLVSADCRRQGVGQALLDAIKALGEEIGKKSLVVSGDNPVHLAWLIPGANGHDHNNAPGVDEHGMGYRFLMDRGFKDDFHEVSMYLNLKNYKWDEALDGMIERLAAEGIRVGRWEIGLGEDYNGMCDRVGSEYWRNVLKCEIAAWHAGQPNEDPELWVDGVKPAGPRPILTATKGDKIVGFTGPVDLQKSGRGWFTGICTDPEIGGKGAGSVLFNLLMKEFVEEGAQFCSLFTGLDNHAQKIYYRAGLRVIAHFAVLSCPLGGGKGYEKRYY